MLAPLVVPLVGCRKREICVVETPDVSGQSDITENPPAFVSSGYPDTKCSFGKGWLCREPDSAFPYFNILL